MAEAQTRVSVGREPGAIHWKRLADHSLLIFFCFVMLAPVLLIFLGAGREEGLQAAADVRLGSIEGYRANFKGLMELPERMNSPTFQWMFWSSLLQALGIATATTAISFMAAYAMSRLTGRIVEICFWLTVGTLLFPVEARVLNTFDIVTKLGLINTWTGAVLPVLPLALATLVFRQHFKLLPAELFEAARLDGASTIRYLRDFALPLSAAPIGAVYLISFVYGWNQYLWPLIVSLDDQIYPLMRGLNHVQSGSGEGMMIAAVSMIPPLILVIGFLRLLTQLTAIRQ